MAQASLPSTSSQEKSFHFGKPTPKVVFSLASPASPLPVPSCIPQHTGGCWDSASLTLGREGGSGAKPHRHVEPCTGAPKSPQAPSGWGNLLQIECLCKHTTSQLGSRGLQHGQNMFYLQGEKLGIRSKCGTWSVCTEKFRYLLGWYFKCARVESLIL